MPSPTLHYTASRTWPRRKILGRECYATHMLSSHPSAFLLLSRPDLTHTRMIKQRGIDALVNECLIGPVLGFGATFVGYACGLVAFVYLRITNPEYNSDGSYTPIAVAFGFLSVEYPFITTNCFLYNDVAYYTNTRNLHLVSVSKFAISSRLPSARASIRSSLRRPGNPRSSCKTTQTSTPPWSRFTLKCRPRFTRNSAFFSE